MTRIAPDAPSSTVLEPVADVVDAALRNLPDAPDLAVEVGEVTGFSELRPHALVLSHHLVGDAVCHPDEWDGPLPPLDRWRRALSCVLEAVALRVLEARTGEHHREDWLWRGLAVERADAALPEAGLALPDLARALATGDPGTWPRAGAAVLRAVAARGGDPWAAAVRWVRTPPPVTEWLSLGTWVLGGAGLSAQLPAPVPRVEAADIPLELGPWRWRPLDVPPHPRGGRIDIHGDGAVGVAWAVAGQPLRTLAAAGAGGAAFRPDVGGPVGLWAATSAHGFGQVFGVRGISFELSPSGKLTIVLADAFAGPLAAIEVAEQVGTSGVITGRWHVAGPAAIKFDRISNQGLTMHGRTRDPFKVPSEGLGTTEWIAALEDGPWAWRREEDKLVLAGRMMGGEVEMWWRLDN